MATKTWTAGEVYQGNESGNEEDQGVCHKLKADQPNWKISAHSPRQSLFVKCDIDAARE
jgi:hypothetical protein